MNRLFDPFEFAVQRCGCVAFPLFSAPAQGSVIAVFDSSFYVDIDGEVACIGTENICAGPLNLTTTAPATTNWHASGLRPGTPVVVANQLIKIGERFVFQIHGSKSWAPPLIPETWNSATLAQGLVDFRRLCGARLPDDGLGHFIDLHWEKSSKTTTVSKAAKAPISEAGAWFLQSFRDQEDGTGEDLNWVRALVGMGPGLTPSGDDFIGGGLLTLQAIGKPMLCQRLWRKVRQYARASGNAISAAHLATAAAGMGSAGIHHMMNAILAGRNDEILATLDDIDAIGHTSGWDIMAGIVTVLDTWMNSQIETGNCGNIEYWVGTARQVEYGRNSA